MSNKTPRIIAAQKGHTPCVSRLLEAGAKIDATSVRLGAAWRGVGGHALGTARACARDGAGRARAASARAGACAARPAAPPAARRPSSSPLVARRTLVALRRTIG